MLGFMGGILGKNSLPQKVALGPWGRHLGMPAVRRGQQTVCILGLWLDTQRGTSTQHLFRGFKNKDIQQVIHQSDFSKCRL